MNVCKNYKKKFFITVFLLLCFFAKTHAVDCIDLSSGCAETHLLGIVEEKVSGILDNSEKTEKDAASILDTVKKIYEDVSDILDIKEDTLDLVGTLTIITGPQPLKDGENIISEPGSYMIENNTNGCITIDADDVWLGLQGATLFCETGPAITVLQGHKNIEIINGKIRGKSDLSNDGILIEQDCELINIEDISIYSCDSGLHMEGTLSEEIKGGCITNCVFDSCDKGVFLEYTKKMVFKNCKSLNCIKAGFAQEHSWWNIFTKCEAIETSSNAPDERSIGFSSTGGTGNLFKGCTAEGTSKTISNFCHGAIGFLLAGTEGDMEKETKIINSIANTTLVAGLGNAYGILLEPVLLSGTLGSLLADSFDHGNSLNSVDWSTDGKYLAIGGLNSGAPDNVEVRVLKFDGLAYSEITTFIHGNTVNSVDWSPDGNYLAIGGQNSGAPDNVEVRVLRFNGSSLIDIFANYSHGATVNSVNWSSDGKYLAIVGQVSGAIEVRVLQFNGLVLTPVPGANYSHGATVNSVDWSPDRKYLAIGGQSSGAIQARVLKFNGATLTNISVNYSHGATVNSVSWSSDGKYLSISGQDSGLPDNVEVRVLTFDGSSLADVANYSHGDTVNSVDWSPDGKYLAIGGQDSSGIQVRVLEFDGSDLQEVKSYDHGATINSVDWSPDGMSIVVGGLSGAGVGTPEVRAFSAMDAPSNCLLQCNKVCNAHGPGGFQGIGISASGKNVYFGNYAYANDVSFNPAIFTTFLYSLFGPLEGVPDLLDNIGNLTC